MLKTKRWTVPAAVLALLLLAACSTSADNATGTSGADANATDENKPHWSYTGEDGPENWGTLGAAYTTCVDGSAQSPIDLTGATEKDLPDIGFTYTASPLEIFNNGHTIEVESEDGGSIDLGGQTYDVVQFHFHAGSEHTVDGKQYPLELHIVHSTADKKLAVVGVLIEVGAKNDALAPVFDNIPTEVSEKAHAVEGASVNLNEVLPAKKTNYQYPGSLTTPPCTEGVSWQVLDTPIQVSAEQLAAFTTVIDGNFRPPLPLGGRELDHDTATN